MVMHLQLFHLVSVQQLHFCRIAPKSEVATERTCTCISSWGDTTSWEASASWKSGRISVDRMAGTKEQLPNKRVRLNATTYNELYRIRIANVEYLATTSLHISQRLLPYISSRFIFDE